MSERTNERTRARLLTEEYRITEAPENKGLAVITARLARGNMINRNLRYYSADVLAAAAERASERAEQGMITGLMDHPNWWNGEGDKGKPERIVIRWNKVFMDGADLMGEGLIVNTALGRDLLALHEADVHIGLSTNAYALSDFRPAEDVPAAYDGDKRDWIEVIEELELLTIDVVNDPANEHARILAEARTRRESFARGKDRIVDEAELRARIEELESQLAERDERIAELEAELAELRGAAEEQRREAIAREELARAYPNAPQPLVEAAVLFAQHAASDDAARDGVRGLAASVKTGNGNNKVPESKGEDGKPKGDPLREARDAIRESN